MLLSDETDIVNIYILIATATTIAAIARVCKRATESQRKKRKHGCSVPGQLSNRSIGRKAPGRRRKECYIFYSDDHNHETGSRGSAFNEAEFEGRFRRPRAVYNGVRRGVLQTDKFFQESKDCVGNPFSTTDQKIVAAFRQLSLGVSAEGLV